jgi:hypothetical protein
MVSFFLILVNNHPTINLKLVWLQETPFLPSKGDSNELRRLLRAAIRDPTCIYTAFGIHVARFITAMLLAVVTKQENYSPFTNVRHMRFPNSIRGTDLYSKKNDLDVRL